MPHSIALQKQHADDLVVITVNFDQSDSRQSVLDLLRQVKATDTINLMSRAAAAEDAFETFDVPDASLPHYKLYDRQGELFQSLTPGDPDQPLTPERIDATVAAALAVRQAGE